MQQSNKKPRSTPSKKGGKSRSATSPTNAPVSKQVVTVTSPARIQNFQSGEVRVSHREFICDIVGTEAIQGYYVNPGNDLLFPWLANISACYSEYLFESLQFEYQPRCSTQSAGSVASACVRPVTDLANLSFLTKPDLLSYQGAQCCAPWQEMRVGSVLDGKWRQMLMGNLASASRVENDLTSLVILAAPQELQCGELYVRYTVRLKEPGTPKNVQSSMFRSIPATNNNLFNQILEQAGPLAVTRASGAAIQFDQPFYGVVVWNATGTNMSNSVLTSGASTTCEVLDTQNVGIASRIIGYVVIRAKRKQLLNLYCVGDAYISGLRWTLAPLAQDI